MKSRSKSSSPNTAFKITFLPDAQADFATLDSSTQKLVLQQCEKLAISPELGDPCGNKYGLDLTTFRSLHFARNAFRIIYKIIFKEKKVQIWGIGKRESERIYRMVAARLGKT